MARPKKRARLAIPDFVRLNGDLLEVQKVKGLERRERAVGLYEQDDSLISLDANQSPNEMELTYVHEVLHGIWPKGVCSNRMEERLIALLEKPLRDAILSGAFEVIRE